MLPNSAKGDVKKKKNTQSWSNNRPMSTSFLFIGMKGVIDFLRRDELKPNQKFVLSQWMNLLGVQATASTAYRTGKSGKSVPVFEDMIVAACKTHSDFANLYFDAICCKLLPNLDVGKALDSLLQATRRSRTQTKLDITTLSKALDENLDPLDRIKVARYLLHAINSDLANNKKLQVEESVNLPEDFSTLLSQNHS